MADNTLQNGTDNIATDDLTTLNGGAVSGVKAQRMKVGWGVDGTLTDVTSTSGLPIQGTNIAASTTSWTSATALNTANTISVASMNTVSVAIVATTTLTGGAITFEVSPDNTNWYPVAMARIDTFTVESVYTLIASTGRAWSTSVDGFTNFRARLSTAIVGTATVGVTIIPQTFAIEPIVNAGVAARTVNGLTPFTLISAATTNATLVKSTPGTIYCIQASNTGASAAFLKLFNLATAPTVGTSVAVKTLIIPAGGGIVVDSNDIGIGFTTGISFSITGVATTADATAVAANAVVVNIDYA